MPKYVCPNPYCGYVNDFVDGKVDPNVSTWRMCVRCGYPICKLETDKK